MSSRRICDRRTITVLEGGFLPKSLSGIGKRWPTGMNASWRVESEPVVGVGSALPGEGQVRCPETIWTQAGV